MSVISLVNGDDAPHPKWGWWNRTITNSQNALSFPDKNSEEENMNSKVTWCLMAFKVTFQKSSNIKTMSNMKATCNSLPFATHCCMGQRSIVEAEGGQLQEGDRPLPRWRTSTQDQRTNLTQKHEALRRMKANTLGLMQNTEVLQRVQRRAVELVKGLEHKSC